MTRSQKKGPYVDEKLFRKVMNQKSSGTTELILRKDGDRISVVEIR